MEISKSVAEYAAGSVGGSRRELREERRAEVKNTFSCEAAEGRRPELLPSPAQREKGRG